MEKPRVLVASPTYVGMMYCWREFIESIKNLDYENYDILIVDNSREDGFFNELVKEEGIIALKDDSGEEKNLMRLIGSRNKILDYASNNNYDFVLMMDSDVIPPKNIISELLECDKDIVSGFYYTDFVVDGKVRSLPVAWLEFTDSEFEEVRKILGLGDEIKKGDLRRHMTAEEANSGEVIGVMHPSAGCMLLSRKVFENIRYGLLPVPNNVKTSDDIYFVKKAKEKGFQIFVNTRVKCEHLFRGKYVSDGQGGFEHPVFK